MKYNLFFVKSRKMYEVMPTIKNVDKLNTELEMFEFTLATLDKKINFDFKGNNGLIALQLLIGEGNNRITKDMYLSNYQETIVAYNPKRYKYVLQCVSPTFKLQRIVLPNKLITQPIEGEKKTLLSEIKKILEVYAPEITLDTYILDIPKINVPCPEMQFTKSTLHEVMIGLFAVAGLVPVMKEFDKLSFIKLKGNKDKQWNSEDIFIRQECSNAVENYSDMLDIDIENAISKNEDINTTWIAPTCEDGILTTENFQWKLPSEIYSLDKVELFAEGIKYGRVPKGGGTPEQVTLSMPIPIRYWIVPKVVYDTLKVSSSIQILRGREWKRNYLYYEGNTISGGFYNEGNWFGEGLNPSIYNIIWLTLEWVEGLSGNVITTLEIPDVRKILIRATYKSENDNSRVKVVKDGVNNPINALVTGQDDSYIDIANFGRQKQELINRMGNESILAQSLFSFNNYDLNTIPNLGEFVDNDLIISEREMLLKENSIMVNYRLSEKYAFETGYSGLNQVKRFTQIDREGTLIRNDNFLYTFRLTTEESAPLVNPFIQTLIRNYGDYSLGVCLHYFEYWDNTEPTQSNLLMLTSQNKKIGNSIICQMGFDDTYVAGYNLEVSGKQQVMNPITYTNNNGEFKYARIYFGDAEEQRDALSLDTITKYPLVKFREQRNHPYKDYLLYKDTREISKFTFQFRMLGSNNVFIYDDFLNYSQLVSHNRDKLKVYSLFSETPFNETNGYNENSITPLGTVRESAKLLFGQNEDYYAFNGLTIIDAFYENSHRHNNYYYAIGVADSNNNLLFACNIKSAFTIDFHKLYFKELGKEN